VENQKETFMEEVQELLIQLESALLELEEAPDDKDQIDRAFRAMHTIKGSGAMFGFDDIADFTHDIETVFELVRDGQVAITQDLVSLTLRACDQIRSMLEEHNGAAPADHNRSQDIIASIRKLVPELTAYSEPAHQDQQPVSNTIVRGTAAYRIRFKPSPDIFKTGANPIHLLNELRDLGECDVTAYTDAIPSLENCDHDTCYIYWDIVITTDKGINAIKDVFIFVEHDSDISIDQIEDELASGGQPKRLGEILVDRGDVSPEALTPLLNAQKRIGEMLVENEVVSKSKVASALAEQKHVKTMKNDRQNRTTAASVRVPAERLDNLVDLVGELVTVQARLSQKAVDENDSELTSIAEDVENLTNGLRDNTMSIRMMQIGSTFTGFKRLVRDLSKELEKDILLNAEGGETELDKTVIDKLNDPMVHIMRNCIDHGIEPPDIRESSGKPRKGTITLAAEHSGANVLIRISDDGAGLNAEGIQKKAVKSGIIGSDADLSEKEIFQLIFAPGFSTAKKVTDVSGRGVGLDVVKKSVESLRGSVGVESKKNEGTSITLKLPLTLAIIEGLLVELGRDKFVMPLSSVDECVELTREESEKVRGRDILNIRGEIVPYIRLRRSFAVNGESPDIEHVVITNINGDRVGFVVDEVIGGHQTVIKPLGRGMKQSEDISGATILGDGTVALILDIDKLVKEQMAMVH
jgi:two-component system chemotaxis sensor kinase CheA